MPDLVVIAPRCETSSRAERLSQVLEYALAGKDFLLLEHSQDFSRQNLQKKRLIFAISLGQSGINLEYFSMLQHIRTQKNFFDGSIGGVIVDCAGPLYTKFLARDLVLSANMAGCAFPGKPLVEGTGSLYNFTIIAKNMNTDNQTAYRLSARNLIKRVMEYEKISVSRPKLLVLYTGDRRKSNTIQLWDRVKDGLHNMDIREISLRNGEIVDCRGCSYTTCLHFGEEQRCFYGGFITQEVYPAVLEANALVMICPNYNDALGGNLTAFVNRLTSLFRANSFYEKGLFSIIVSGYSGSDLVAQQLIGGLNMNKAFFLPPRFAMMETANNPNEAVTLEGIERRIAAYAGSMNVVFS